MTIRYVPKSAELGEQQQFMRERFGTRLRELMDAAKLNHRSLAERAGLDRSTVTRLINAERRANSDQVARLADALGIKPSELWTEAGPGSETSGPDLRLPGSPDGTEVGTRHVADGGSSVPYGATEGYAVKTDQARIVARLIDAIEDERDRNAAMRACLDVLENPRSLGADKRPDRAQRGR